MTEEKDRERAYNYVSQTIMSLRNSKDSWAKAELAYYYVSQTIMRLRNSKDSSAKAELAYLRRGLGHHPADIPEVWGTIFAELYSEDNVPWGSGSNASDGVTALEWSIYITLTLFAAHQQSSDITTNCMSVEKVSLGRALRRLAGNSNEARVWQRFCPIIKATAMDSVAYHLRTLVQLLRAKKIALDYPRLAKELCLFQYPSFRQDVCIGWGRDFFASSIEPTADDNSNK